MKKLILLGIAASVVIGGATVLAQRIPGKGLQQAAYTSTSRINGLIGCGSGGCATQTQVGCGTPIRIPNCPLSGLKHIPRIIPSIQMPDCGSPIMAPCLGGTCRLGAISNSIGRAFARADCNPDCAVPGCCPEPDCAVPVCCPEPDCGVPTAMGPGTCRIMSPGFACLGNGRNSCDSGSCQSGACQECEDGRCEDGRCDDGRSNCRRGSICSRLCKACGSGLCGNGSCCASGCCSQCGWPDRGWNMPVKTPITRNPVSYRRYQPSKWYGSPGSGFAGNFPMVYRPTDTTQLGFISHNVPYWRRGRGPGMPPPASIHNRNCPAGGYTTFSQGYNHYSHHDYPWFQHHMTNANGPQSPAANMAARRPVRRPVMVPRRTAKRPVMQAGFRRTTR
jgi:hypothetical protein